MLATILGDSVVHGEKDNLVFKNSCPLKVQNARGLLPKCELNKENNNRHASADEGKPTRP